MRGKRPRRPDAALLTAGLLALSGCAGQGPTLARSQPEVVDTPPGLSGPDVHARIWDNRSKVEQCWRKATAKHPDAAGYVLVSWQVKGDGSVVNARTTEDTVGSSTLSECLLNTVRSLEFPTFDARFVVDVSYPFNVPRCYLGAASPVFLDSRAVDSTPTDRPRETDTTGLSRPAKPQ